MATDLRVVGPFDIPHQRSAHSLAKQILKSDVQLFWNKPETRQVASKQGIYVFALRAGKGYTPWYVGKSEKSMMDECLATYQRGLYNVALFRGNKGTPVFFYVVPPNGKNIVPHKVLNDMETFFIQSAYVENSSILNTQKKNLPVWTVKSVVRGGKGKSSEVEKAFRKMMGL